MATKLSGVDVSTWNTPFNFSEAKKQGLNFAIIRAGFGREVSQKDNKFEAHYKNAKAAGLKVGFYWYSYATDAADAVKEANACLSVIKGKTAEYPIYFDIEDPSQSKMSKTTATAITKAFCETIEKAGYYAGIYSYISFLIDKIDSTILDKYSTWIAQWSSTPPKTISKKQDMWQYTSNGALPGSAERLSLNYSFIDPTSNLIKPSSEGKPNITYKVQPVNGSWLPEVKNLEDYAGIIGKQIANVAIKVSKGSVKYRAHVLKSGWLPYVTDYNTEDYSNGYAGNGKSIDAIEVIYTPPKGSKQKVRYRVSPVNKDYYPYQTNAEKTNGQDGYAGVFGISIDRLQMEVY